MLGEFGSSPRERGTQVEVEDCGADGRFIPARAGNTPSKCARRRARAVHPRASGEHSRLAGKLTIPAGSSPRERGTRPASEPLIWQNHGSSPRERGTPADPATGRECIRFIPARAGNTPGRSAAPRCSAVHPRASGEHIIEERIPHHDSGSSPRERGTPLAPRLGTGTCRFIPARAGNTLLPSP